MNIPKEVALMGVEQVQEYIKLKEEVGIYESKYQDAINLHYECYDALKSIMHGIHSSPQFVHPEDLIKQGYITKAYELEQISKNIQLALYDLLRYKELISECKQKIKDKFNV